MRRAYSAGRSARYAERDGRKRATRCVDRRDDLRGKCGAAARSPSAALVGLRARAAVTPRVRRASTRCARASRARPRRAMRRTRAPSTRPAHRTPRAGSSFDASPRSCPAIKSIVRLRPPPASRPVRAVREERAEAEAQVGRPPLVTRRLRQGRARRASTPSAAPSSSRAPGTRRAAGATERSRACRAASSRSCRTPALPT